MEITGFDYQLLSNTSFESMENIFLNELKTIWASPVVDIVENESERKWLFIAEDRAMADDEDTGYELNEKQEGCFSIIGVKSAIQDDLVGFINAERKIKSEVRMIQPEAWNYTLVLPAMIDENQFSQRIYNMLVAALAQESSYNNADIFPALPSQSYLR